MALCATLAGCGGESSETPGGGVGAETAGSTAEAPPETSTETLSVYTVNYPLAYFAERVGGDLVRVTFPAPANVDPAFWSPDAVTVAAYQAADLILLNGAGYASWVDRVTLPATKLLLTTGGVSHRYIVEEDAVTHTHGPEGEHSHGQIAFTTWVDPTIASEQAKAIRSALIAARPRAETELVARFDELESELLDLDARLEAAFARIGEMPLLASHPVYQYLDERYGLNLRSVHFEPDEPPGERMWAELRTLVIEHPARWMLWEDDPLESTRARLGQLGVEVVVFRTVAAVPADGDYLAVMEANAASLERAFPNPGPAGG